MTKAIIDESTSGAPGGVSVTVSADPLVLDIPRDLGQAEGIAIAQGIANQIRAITAMSRDGKHRLFNRTGTLANQLTAIAAGAGYDVVAPPGYLQDDALLEQLAALVPAIEDPTVLDELAAAVEAAAAAMLIVG